MFLFLSKLLPLFLYPMGLSCLLLVAAIAAFWKRPRMAAGLVGAALGVLLFSSNAWVAEVLVRGLESQYRPAATYPKVAAIVFLGGATRAPIAPRVWPEVLEAGDRVLYAARLYKEGYAPKLVLTGGRISWKDSTGNSEAEDIETLLKFIGIPQTAMLLERTSLNTHENAVNVKAILARERLDGPILLVTSAIHMPRSMAIFKKERMEAIAAPTDYLFDESPLTQGLPDFVLKLLPDAEAIHQTTIALKEYVGMAVYRLRGWA
ncbi:YdcF family protein [Altericista sp. CCNU0014]|uniref:YdcF family protein n=1 Tax=Altericista sp. CCNU0014 TaxID=3082949 RepID=UPI00384AF18E